MHGNVNLLPEEEEAHGWETANNYFPRRRNAASAIKCRRKIDLSDKDLAKPMPFVGRRDNGGDFLINVLIKNALCLFETDTLVPLVRSLIESSCYLEAFVLGGKSTCLRLS